ncbi:MAG: D-alanyl-D-alanine carboxypeptidase/D-alanyl-D-alanine-endopeptidase [Pseudomonadota bacterium]
MELHQRLLLSAALLLAAASAAAADFDNLARLSARGALVTATVWDLDADKPVAQLTPSQRLTPASLSKVFVAAAALDTWTPDKTFATELRGVGAPTNGTLAGDVILRSEGDATLDETTLWALAAQLRAQGVKHITGRVLVERAPFGELSCDTIDRCNGMRRSNRAYNAAPSAIGVNYGSWCISVRAPAGANRATVGGCASGELPIPLTGNVRIAANGPALSIDRNTDEHGDRITVSGTIGPGEERMVHRAMSDPAAGTGQLLRSILLQTGVVVDGGVETTIVVGNAPQLLARVDGLLLQEQVGRMMRWSNNYIADVLTMGIALARNGVAPLSLADAARQLPAILRSDCCSDAANSPVMESGSGLTVSNLLSAQDLVDTLRHEYHDPRRFPAFYGSFVVPRDAAFDYLKKGSDDWLDRVALKTGSLSEPISVNGIAGFMRKKNGGFMAFAIIVNGSGRTQVAAADALGAARADLTALLARY